MTNILLFPSLTLFSFLFLTTIEVDCSFISILPCDMIQGVPALFDCFFLEEKISNQLVWQQQHATAPQCAVASGFFLWAMMGFIPICFWDCNVVFGFLDGCFATFLFVFTGNISQFFAWDIVDWFFLVTDVLQGESTINACFDFDKLFCHDWSLQVDCFIYLFLSHNLSRALASFFPGFLFSQQTAWRGKIKNNNQPVHIISRQSASAHDVQCKGGLKVVYFDFLTGKDNLATFSLATFCEEKTKLAINLFLEWCTTSIDHFLIPQCAQYVTLLNKNQ